jgi:DNA-binding CsgD family transcriptional regulator
VHPVVRASVYAELSRVERSQRHREAAAILAERGADEDETALHLLAGEPAGDPSVVDVLRRAARRAHARGAPDVAATYLQRAMSEPPSAEARVDVLVELGAAESGALRASTGIARTREALELAEAPATRARVALELGKALVMWGNFPDAATVTEEALAELGDHDAGLRHRLEAQLIGACLPVPAFASRVIDRLDRLWQDRALVEDPVLLALVGTAGALTHPPAGTGAGLAGRALADRRLSMDEDPAAVAFATVGLLAADRLEQVLVVWDPVIEDARQGTFAVGFARTLRALALARLGALDRAEADIRRTLKRLGDDPRLALAVPIMLATLLDVLLERGELDAASEVLDQYSLTGELLDVFQLNLMLERRGRLRLSQNRREEGLADLRECGRRTDGWMASPWAVCNPALIAWRSSLAPALAAAGDRDEALVLAREEVELARAYDVPRELGMALRAAGLVESGNRGIELLREAVAVLESTPAALEHARALTDLGAALRRANRRADAREPLRVGLDLAQRCGATALVERAHRELLAAGARPRRLLLRGVESLTASERRVAELAAAGRTNREIAQTLFVTEKTVESHLGHVYRKLDIASRSQLAGALTGLVAPDTRSRPALASACRGPPRCSDPQPLRRLSGRAARCRCARRTSPAARPLHHARLARGP